MCVLAWGTDGHGGGVRGCGVRKCVFVHVMYYHTKEGAKHLERYASRATEVGWEYTEH